MEELFRCIDELARVQCPPWQRTGTQLHISLPRYERSQTVRIARQKDRYVFSSVVARVSDVRENRRALAYRLWRRNALMAVVTFTIDRRDRVIGLIELTIKSAHPKEIKFYFETLARECDRLEYILTGADTR